MLKFFFIILYLNDYFISFSKCNTSCCCKKNKEVKNYFNNFKKYNNEEEDSNKDNDVDSDDNEYKINFSKNDNNFDKSYNKNFNEILIKYINIKKLDYNKCKFEIKNIKSKNHCRKVIIDNNKIVYIEINKYDNSFHIDLLKYLNFCELQYIRSNECILTEEIKNNYEINFNFSEKSLDEIYIFLPKINNIFPFYTILSFLNFKDCGTLKLNNNIIKKIDNDTYLINILDVDLNVKSNIKIKNYYDFYYNLNTGTKLTNKKYMKEISQLYKFEDSDIKRFYIFINIISEILEVINFKDKYNLEDIDINNFNNFKNLIKCEYLENYIDTKKENKKDFLSRYESLLNIYNNNFNEFLRNFIKYIYDNCQNKEEYYNFLNNDDILKYLEIDKINNEENEIMNTIIKLYDKCIKKIDPYFKYLNKFFKIFHYLGDNIDRITDNDKKEIIEKFDKMLDFLIDNKNNEKYNNEDIQRVVKNIKEVQEATLFPFIFGDKNIINKINMLTLYYD